MTAIKVLRPESNTSFLHEGSREIGTMCRYVSSADPHCTAATTMKHPRGALLEEGLCLERKCAEQNLYLHSLLHTATHTGGGAPGASSKHGTTVGEERGHHSQGADGTRQCSTGWNLHMEVSGTLSVYSGIIFPLDGMRVSQRWDLGNWEAESQRAQVIRGTRLPVTHTTHRGKYATWSTK